MQLKLNTMVADTYAQHEHRLLNSLQWVYKMNIAKKMELVEEQY